MEFLLQFLDPEMEWEVLVGMLQNGGRNDKLLWMLHRSEKLVLNVKEMVKGMSVGL